MIDQLVGEERARDASESARRHLVAAVSHDLRTPLTSLRLLADAVGDDIVDQASSAASTWAGCAADRHARRADR